MSLGGTVVITGAARGLGLVIARRFLAEGPETLVLCDVDEGELAEAATGFPRGTARIEQMVLDVSDRDAVIAAIDEAMARSGRLDVLINNAGVLSPNGRVHNLSVADWARCFDINVMGVVNGIAAAVPHMRRLGGGSIVNTASAAGITPFPYAAPYSASKAAIISVTRCAALEYARDRIRVNCVCPGTFQSHIHDNLPEGALDAMGAKHPLGLGSAEDVAGAFVYLAGSDSTWTTGSCLVVDGGYVVQ